MPEADPNAPDWPRPVHWTIHAVDPERQRISSAAMFQWAIGDGPFHQIAPGFGGPEPGPGGHIQAPRPGVSLYVQVRDLRESLDRAVELGGTIIAEPFQFPGQPTLASIADPEGNELTLVQQRDGLLLSLSWRWRG